jgi:MFS family permease
MGGTPIGAPIVGWVANEFGPRWALGVGAASGFTAALVGLFWLVKYRHLRVHYGERRLRLTHDGRARAAEEIVTTEVLAQKG